MNSLLELFGEDATSLQLPEKILIMDLHNLAYRCVFSAIHVSPEDGENFYLWKHMMINSIFNTIKRFQPNKVILAADKKGNWRYNIYPQYKSNRKEFRENSKIDFEKFLPIFNDFIEDIKNTFTKLYVLNIEKCEADDIIAILSKETFKNKNIIIVTSDKDMNQLLSNRKIQQFDAMNNKFIECLNPRKDLDIKILVGDKGDTIPSVKKKVGVKTAEKILNEGLDTFLNKPENKEIKTNWERNKILIDFNFIPEDIKKSIINTYNEYQLKDIQSTKLMTFFVRNKMNKLMSEWQLMSPIFKELN
jgi:5'-3' exonuclease